MKTNRGNNYRTIKTARTEAAINEAIEQGYIAIIKPVVPSAEIKSKFAIIKEKATGKIKVIHDYRAMEYQIIPNEHSQFETVIGFTDYYPYHFESPFAAYLVPPDIQVEETVWVEDVIEDIVGSRWNQGDTSRLRSCEAIWNGKELELLYSSISNRYTAIG